MSLEAPTPEEVLGPSTQARCPAGNSSAWIAEGLRRYGRAFLPAISELPTTPEFFREQHGEDPIGDCAGHLERRHAWQERRDAFEAGVVGALGSHLGMFLFGVLAGVILGAVLVSHGRATP